MADLIHKPQRVEERHGDRVNLIRSDGAGDSASAEALQSYEGDGQRWEDTRASSFDTAFNDLFLSVDRRGRATGGLWTVLDGR